MKKIIMMIALMGSVTIAQAVRIAFKNVSHYNLNIIFDTFDHGKKVITLTPNAAKGFEDVKSFTITATAPITSKNPAERINYTHKVTPEDMEKINDFSTLEINVDPKAFFNKPIQIESVEYGDGQKTKIRRSFFNHE